MQRFFAIGRLTNDIEISTTNSGITVARFSLAIKRDRPNKNGEYETDFFTAIVYGKTAENCGKYLKKGSQVAIVSKVHNRSYEAKDGTKRYVTELYPEEVQFLSTGSGTNKQETKSTNTAPELEEIDGDNLPF